ncbi:hypothetical protein [Nocardioides sp.]|uniref:hypothetical protein n=1 Tax=Nocardioides sp. TaxID=35761 RepID=UPI0035180EB9
MSHDLDDLRRTLHEHRHDLHDEVGTAARLHSVHRRIRRARRRRATAVGSVLALAIGGGGGWWLSTGDARPDPAPAASLFGIDVPESIRIEGMRYDLASLTDVGLGREQTVRARGADARPALRALVVAGLDEGYVTLSTGGDLLARAHSDGLTPAAETNGDRVDVTSSQDTDVRVGVATYVPTTDLGPGLVGPGGTTFRQTSDGRVLERAVFARPGRPAALSLTTATAGPVWTMSTCATALDGLWVREEIDGEPRVWSTCGPEGDLDAARDSARVDTLPAGTTVGIVVSRTRNGPPVTVSASPGAPDVTLGLALYRPGPEVETTMGPMAREILDGGRRWVLDRILTANDVRTDPDLATPAVTGDDRLVRLANLPLRGVEPRGPANGGRDVTITLTSPSDTLGLTQTGSAFSGSLGTVGTMLSGETYRITLTGPGAGEALVLVYRPSQEPL